MLSLGTLSLLIILSDTENAAAYAQINTQQIYITFLLPEGAIICNTWLQFSVVTVQMTETLSSESHHKNLTDYFCKHPLHKQ